MYCLAVLQSGNYVYSLCRLLEKRGYVFEVINLPCQLSKGGCSYCLKFPESYREIVIEGAKDNKTPVMEMYRLIPGVSRNRYERIL